MININLLPPEIKLKEKKAKQSASVFGFCLIIVILLGVVTSLLNTYKQNLLQPQLDSYNADITKANSGLTNFNELQNKALLINDRDKLSSTIQNSQSPWSQILMNLSNTVPTDVQIISLSADLTKSPNFSLQATTTNENGTIKFKDKLSNSTSFKDVVFKSSTVTSNTSGTQNIVNFTLEFNLNHTTQKAAQ